jgi:putative phosphoribosyl transferase
MVHDRQEAGQVLAKKLMQYKNKSHAIVIALPRGGVVIGYEIAKILHLPLDIVIPRKIGAPFNEELAIGAICQEESYFDERLIRSYQISKSYIQQKIHEEQKEAERRSKLYRQNRKPLDLKNKIVLLTDDGIATGATMIASLKFIKTQKPKKIIIAIPIASQDTIEYLEKQYSLDVVCTNVSTNLMSISQGYELFPQVNDDEVISLMQQSEKFSNS